MNVLSASDFGGSDKAIVENATSGADSSTSVSQWSILGAFNKVKSFMLMESILDHMNQEPSRNAVTIPNNNPRAAHFSNMNLTNGQCPDVDCIVEDPSTSSHNQFMHDAFSLIHGKIHQPASTDCMYKGQVSCPQPIESPDNDNQISTDNCSSQTHLNPTSGSAVYRNESTIRQLSSTDCVYEGKSPQSPHLTKKSSLVTNVNYLTKEQPSRTDCIHKANLPPGSVINTDDLMIRQPSSTDCLYEDKPHQSSHPTLASESTIKYPSNKRLSTIQPSSTDCWHKGKPSQSAHLTPPSILVTSTHDSTIRQPSSTDCLYRGKRSQSTQLNLPSKSMINENNSTIRQPSSTDCLREGKPLAAANTNNSAPTIIDFGPTSNCKDLSSSILKHAERSPPKQEIETTNYDYDSKSMHNDIDKDNVLLSNTTAARSLPSNTVEIESTSISNANKEIECVYSPTATTTTTTAKHIRRFVMKNVSLFPHGIIRTLVAITSAIAALILSFVCKNSTNYMLLQNPIYVGPLYKDVTEVGLFFLDLCIMNKELESTYIDGGVTTNVRVQFFDERSFYDDVVGDLPPFFDGEISSNAPETYDVGNINIFDDESDMFCRKLKLGIVEDDLWNVSRISVGMSGILGCLMTVVLLTTVVWKTINLKPVIVGLFMTYAAQVMAFFFSDSDLCALYGCNNGRGANVAIASGAFWFISGVAVVMMQFWSKQDEKLRASELQQHGEKVLKGQRGLFHSILSMNLVTTLIHGSSLTEETVESLDSMNDPIAPILSEETAESQIRMNDPVPPI